MWYVTSLFGKLPLFGSGELVTDIYNNAVSPLSIFPGTIGYDSSMFTKIITREK